MSRHAIEQPCAEHCQGAFDLARRDAKRMPQRHCRRLETTMRNPSNLLISTNFAGRSPNIIIL